LYFDHICKIEFFDEGIIEVSNNNGVTWTKLTGTQYQGASQFATQGNKFTSAAYTTDWAAGTYAVPTNIWWKSEIFDISALVGNAPSVKVRFVLRDVNMGSTLPDNYAWFIDNIRVVGAFSELVPPTISLAPPLLTDTTFSTGPFTVNATITDASGISAAKVIYTVNNGTPDTVNMTLNAGVYSAVIPSYTYNSTICWKIMAVDSSAAFNVGYYPVSGCKSMFIMVGPTVVTIGNGTVVNTNTSYPAPYGNYYYGARHQFLILASELNAAGLSPGQIMSAAFNVATVQGTALQGFTIKIGHTSLNALTSTFLTNLTTVYTVATYTETTGWNTHTFQTPFAWNGVDNLVIEACFNNTSYTNNAIVYQTATSFASSNYYRSDASGICAYATGTTINQRPNIQLASPPSNFPYDAGVMQIQNPTGTVIANTNLNVDVLVKNFGTNALTKATVHCSLDGVLQTPSYVWTGNLLQGVASAPVTIDTVNVPVGSHTIKAWTTGPNDSLDINGYNDTAVVNFFACTSILNGSYTVGGTGADFATLADATQALTNCGINGPVVLNLAPGIYTGQWEFGLINGISDVNTVTFRSASGNPADVTWQLIASPSANYVVRFNGAKYIIMKGITIKSTNVSYGRIVEFMGNSQHITIDSCILDAPLSTSSSAVPLYSTTSADYNITVSNSTLKGGYYGVYYYTSNASKKYRFNLINNIIQDYYYYGVYTYYTDSLRLIGNKLQNQTASGTLYPMYIGYTTGWGEISKNRIISTNTGTNYGLYIYYKQSTSTDTLLVSNNFISQSGNLTGTVYSVYVYGSYYINFYNNSVHVTGGTATAGRVFYMYSGGNINVVNNTFSNTNGGYAYYNSSATYINVSNYNNLYSTGANLAYWGGNQANLTALQAASGKDTNSVSLLPPFAGTHDLALTNTLLSAKATPLPSVPDDIFGNPRTPYPTIGAHEVPLIHKDAGVINFVTPTPQSVINEGGTVPVTVTIQNFGMDTLTTADVYFSVNGGTPSLTTFTGTLLPFQTTPVIMNSYTSPAGNTHLCAYTVLPGDSNTFNDSTCITYYAIPITDGTLVRVRPVDEGCGLGLDTIQVVVKNTGATAISGIYQAFYKLEGGNDTLVQTVTGPLAVNDTVVVTFDTLADFSSVVDSMFKILAWISVPGDNVAYNDTASRTVNSLKIPPPPVINDTTIPYASFVTLYAVSTDSVKWFASDTASATIATGPYYTTPILFDTTVYWVAVQSGVSSASPPGINVAPLAVANASTCNTGACSTLNDLNLGTCGTQQMWIATSTPPSTTPHVEWMDFTWPTAQTINKMKIHHAETSARFLSGASLYWWDGAGWVFFHTFSNLPMQCENEVFFPTISTTRLRMTSFVLSGSQLSNPNFREIEIFSAPATGCYSNRIPVTVNVGGIPPYDLGISELLVKTGCAVYTEPITIKVYNQGTDTLKGGATASYKINSSPWITPETITDTILPGGFKYYTFSTLANLAAPLTGDTMFTIWATVNVTGDPNHQNDSIMADSLLSLETPAAPVVTSPVNIPYGTQATLTAQSPMPVEWFASDTASLKLDTGYTYVTPPLYDTTTYWVQAGSAMGPPSALYTGTQSSNYAAAQTRGFHFTAPVNMTITGLMVPNTVTSGGQYIQVVKFSGYPVVYPNGSPFTTLAMITNAPFGVVQPVNIPIAAGDEIGIIGATNSSGTTMNNSYGSPQVPSSIGGIPVVLTRLVYQSPLVSGPAATGSISLEVAANIARIDVTYVVGGLGCPSLRVPVVVNTSAPPAVDAGISQIVNPYMNAASNVMHPIQVRLKNYGLNALTSAKIVWSLDNVIQDTTMWAGSLANAATVDVTLDTMSFNGGVYCIKAWTILPNGSPDPLPLNDTANHCFNACLGGVYTIGPATTGTWDYNTFNQAVTALQTLGICGHVIFDVQPGTYTEQVTLPAIPGTSANQTVTFRGTGDSTQAILEFSASSTANWTLRLDGADYFRFEKLTIRALNTTYGRVVEMINGAMYNRFAHNQIISAGTSTSTTACIYDYNTLNHYNTYLNNYMNGGYYGMYIYGVSSTSWEKGTVIKGNTIRGTYYYPIYVYYGDSVEVIGNLVDSVVGNYSYGINLYYTNNYYRIVGNTVRITGTSGTSYGIRDYYCNYYSYNASPTGYGLVANNMVSISGSTSGHYGMYAYYCNGTEYYYNTVSITGGSTSYYGLYQANTTSNTLGQKFVNNLFSNTGGGYAAYFSTPASVLLCDYNNYYATGVNLAYWSGAHTTLASLQAASGKNVHSVNINPPFKAVHDLHLSNTGLSSKATPITSITTDIDGDPRGPLPTIGADEIPLIPKDAGVTAILSPGTSTNEGQSYPVQVTVANFGTDTLFMMDVQYTVNNGTPVVFQFNDTLVTGATKNITMPSMISPAGNSTICAKTLLVGDTNYFNDEMCKNFFGTPVNDAQTTRIVGLKDACNIGADTISIWIKNNGASAINSPTTSNIVAKYQLNGVMPVVSQNVTQVIPVNDSVLFHFTSLANLISLLTDSIYNVVAWVELQGDNVKYNDTAKFVVKSLHIPPSPIGPTVAIPYATQALVSATSPTNDTILWYLNPTGGTHFHMGNSFTTGILYNDTTFYAEAVGALPLQTFFLGTGTVQNTNTTYPAPYGNWYWGSRDQYLIRASELTALGMVAGDISELAFNVLTAQATPLQGFTIKMGLTTVNDMTTSFISTPLTTVYSTGAYTETVGWNTHAFIAPFQWDGTSNLVVDVCFNNSGYTYNAVVAQTSTPFNSSINTHQDAAGTCALATGTTYTQRPNIRFKAGGNGCGSARVPVLVDVQNQQPCDVGVSTILQPTTAINLTAQEDVKVRVQNYGTAAQSNVTVSYQVNNLPVVTETITASIPSNSFVDYTFTAKANLGVAGTTYQLKAWASIGCDATHLNDTAWRSVTNLLPNYCISTANSALYQEISNVTLGTMNNTSAVTGAMYTNHSLTVLPPMLSPGVTYPMSITSSFAPSSSTQQSCWLKAWIDLNRDGAFDATTEMIFSQATTSSNTVTANIQIPFTALTGNTMMRVVLQQTSTASLVVPCGTYNYGETEDYMVTVAPQATCDAGVIQIMEPTQLSQAGVVLPVWLKFMNFGSNPIPAGNLSIAYKLNNGTPVVVPYPGGMASGAIDSIQMPSLTLLQGNNTLCAYTILACDSTLFNNEICINTFGQFMASLPFFDDFEGANNWYKPIESVNWQYGTPSANIINAAYGGNKSWVTNLTGDYSNNANEYLYSPLFDFNGLGSTDTITLSFYHWCAMAASDYGRVQYSTNAGQTWSNLGFYMDVDGTNWYNITSGGLHYFSHTNSGWMYSAYKLNPLVFNGSSDIQFRFHFWSNSSGTSNGWAIDNFKLSLPQAPNDVGVSLISYPVNDTAMGSQVIAKAVITNFGTNTQTMIPIVLKINGVTTLNETWTGNLASTATTTYTFVQPFTVPSSSYNLCIETQLANDAYTMNDFKCKQFTPQPAYHDVGAVLIVAPLPDSIGEICLYEPNVQPWYQFVVKVRLQNFGQNAQTSIPLKYTFYNGGTVVTETWTGNLAPGTTVDVDLTNKFLPNMGAQQLCVETNLTGDLVVTNNKACQTYIGRLCIGVDEMEGDGFAVGQNIPNPATGRTLIPFLIPEGGEVQIRITDLPGQTIHHEVLVKPAGEHTLELDVSHMAQGVYYYTLEYRGHQITRKLVVRK